MDGTVGIGVVGHSMRVGDEPLLFTVHEAARVLGIGRTLAYRLARQYLASGGRHGLPEIRLGRCLRVPRWALLEFVLHGRVVRLSELVEPAPRRLKRRRITVRRAVHARSGAERRALSSHVAALCVR
jgi:Helix-turn-helix domain